MRSVLALLVILSFCGVYGQTAEITQTQKTLIKKGQTKTAQGEESRGEKVVDRLGRVFYKSLNQAVYGTRLEAKLVPGSARSCGLAVRDHYLYTCGYRHFTIYDISNPLKPVMTASIQDLSPDCRQICVYKNLVCITARTDGLYIFDIKNPAQPVLLNHYDTIELATGITCDNDIAYICQRQYGTEFVDISKPEHPRHIGFVLSGEAQSIDTANGILYAGDWGTRKFSVFDVRNPKNPQFIGEGSLDGLGDGVYVRDGIGYAATGLVATKDKVIQNDHEGNGLDIFSLADLKHPKLLSRFPMPIQAFTMYPDLWGVQVCQEKIAYVNNTYNGVFCLDVSNPAQPQSIAYAIPWNEKENRPDFMASLAIVDDVIYAAGYQVGLWVIPAKGIAKRLTPRTNMPVPQGPVASDVPANEELLQNFSFYKTNSQIGAVCKDPDGKSLWVAAGADGIHHIEIRGNQPVCLKKYPTPSAAYDVKRVGDLLLCAQTDKGLAIYKVGKGISIKEIGRFTTFQSVRQVVVSDDAHWAIIKVGNGILFFLDISRPESPRVVLKDSYPHGIMYGREIVQSITKEGIASAFFWSFGFAWYDLSGDTPKKLGLKPAKSSTMFGGAIQNGKLYYSQKTGFYIFDLLDTSLLDKKSFYLIPNYSGGGKIFMNGSFACVVHRRNGTISTFDFTNSEKPKLLNQYKVKGHPDLGIFLDDGRMVIPCGYAGLMIEKR